MKKYSRIVILCLLLSLLGGCSVIRETVLRGTQTPPPDEAFREVFEIQNQDGYAEYRIICYGKPSMKLTELQYVYYLSKDNGYRKAAIEAYTDEQWEAVLPGLPSYDFAERSIEETQDAIVITITLHELDKADNLRRMNEHGAISWEGGDSDYADAESLMQSLTDDGAVDAGSTLTFQGFQ